MRILHLTSFLQGGAGRVVRDLALLQSSRGDRVGVLTSRTGVEGYGNYPQYLGELRRGGVEVVEADSLFFRDPGGLLAALDGAGSLLERLRPEILHGHAAFPALGALVLRGSSFPGSSTLMTMHGWGLRKSPEMERADVAVMSRVDRVVAVAQTGRDFLLSKGLSPERVEVIYNGVDSIGAGGLPGDPLWSALKEEKGRGKRIIGCLGTLGERKNQALLLEAFVPLARRFSDLILLFIGDGDESPLRERAEREGLRERVVFGGYRPQGDAYLSLFDLLVLPSRNEGMPLTLLEALRERVPILASSIPEHREILQEGALGALFPVDNREALEALLEESLALTPGERTLLVERGAQRFAERFSREKMEEGYRALYAALRGRG